MIEKRFNVLTRFFDLHILHYNSVFIQLQHLIWQDLLGLCSVPQSLKSKAWLRTLCQHEQKSPIWWNFPERLDADGGFIEHSCLGFHGLRLELAQPWHGHPSFTNWAIIPLGNHQEWQWNMPHWYPCIDVFPSWPRLMTSWLVYTCIYYIPFYSFLFPCFPIKHIKHQFRSH